MDELARIEKVVVLQSSDLFTFCKADEILRIAAISGQRRAVAGEGIYAANESAQCLFCVVQGEVELERPGGDLLTVGPLQTFGVREILSGRLRAGDARAATDCLLLEIDADDLFDLLAHNIEIVKALFRQVLE